MFSTTAAHTTYLAVSACSCSSIGGGGAEEFVLPATADAATELRRGSAHLRHALTAVQYREAGWPTHLSGALPAACRALPAPLLETVAAELRAPHVLWR